MILSTQTPFAVLGFANFAMLGWLAAAALPWLIHRWFRQRHQTTSWAAIELLQKAMQHQGRRVQMQQWLLLAIRTAILVLVALAAAEPALRQWSSSPGGKVPTHRILVLDQSYSMGCEQSGQSRWQSSQLHARQWIKSSDGDTLTLLGWAAQAENLVGRPTKGTSIALAALEDLQLSESIADLTAALQAINVAIERAEIEIPQITTHHVVFCTDLGSPTWSINESQRELLEELARRASVTVVNVAEGSSSNNFAVTDVQIYPPITLLQQETTITATVSCFKDSPSTRTTVELLIEGRRVGQQEIDLQENTESAVRFTHRFVDEGPHTVQVKLADHKDCLRCDDVRWLIVNVRPKLQVACFAGQPNAVDDLARALAPTSKHEGLIRPEIFPVSRLGETDIFSYPAIILGSVAELSPRESATLTEYVRQGGGLAVFLESETIGPLPRLLPVQIEHLQSAGEYHFDPLEYRHAIVSPFRGQAKSGLLGVSISQYRRMQLLTDHPSADVVLKFDTGDPMLVVGRFGLGRVAVSALPGALAVRAANGTPWSSFAMSPSFLPVVRELVTYLVGDNWLQQRNLLLGESAVLPWKGNSKTASVRLPDGVRQVLPPLSAEDHGQRVFLDTKQSGVYQFVADEKECARFAVNLDGRESDLTPVDQATLPIAFAARTAREGSVPTVKDSFSLARIVLAGVLGLLLLEIGLAWFIGRGWR